LVLFLGSVTDSVSNYIGQHVKVCDKVAEAFRPARESSITYLNFGGKYPNHKFTVVIFAKDLVNFPFSPVEKYKNHNVCESGMAADYKGKPQILATFPDQMETLWPNYKSYSNVKNTYFESFWSPVIFIPALWSLFLNGIP